MFQSLKINVCSLLAIIILQQGCLVAQVVENSPPEQEYNLKRRYWGDEMSSCLEIYCFKYLNTRFYLKCLSEYCPDAILVLPTRRDLSKEPTFRKLPSVPYFQGDLVASSNVLSADAHDFSKGIICRSHSYSTVKYCLENICYVISGNPLTGSDAMQPRIDVAGTICKQTECDLREGEALQLCVIERCC